MGAAGSGRETHAHGRSVFSTPAFCTFAFPKRVHLQCSRFQLHGTPWSCPASHTATFSTVLVSCVVSCDNFCVQTRVTSSFFVFGLTLTTSCSEITAIFLKTMSISKVAYKSESTYYHYIYLLSLSSILQVPTPKRSDTADRLRVLIRDSNSLSTS